MNKPRLLSLLSIISILLAVTTGFAQRHTDKTKQFEYDIVSFPTPALQNTEVFVFIWISHAHLQFVKEGAFYSARYQINLECYRDGKSLLTRDETYATRLKNYSDTISEEIWQSKQFVFDLEPGKYKFRLRVVDLNSGKTFPEEVKREIPDFSLNKPQLSDILLLTTNQFDTLSADIVLPPRHIPIQDKLYLFALARIPDGAREIEIAAYRKQIRESLIGQTTMTLTDPVVTVFLLWPKKEMVRGRVLLSLQVRSGELVARKEKTFYFYGSINTLSTESIAEKIEQLRYVAPAKEWHKMMKADDEEKVKLFKEFWARRDPTPGTPENELFDEYYKRVELANEQFGDRVRPGWRTDRGRVFIIYGPPDHVERKSDPLNSISSYEIWYYQDLQKKFVFLDEQGFGEYRLVSGMID